MSGDSPSGAETEGSESGDDGDERPEPRSLRPSSTPAMWRRSKGETERSIAAKQGHSGSQNGDGSVAEAEAEADAAERLDSDAEADGATPEGGVEDPGNEGVEDPGNEGVEDPAGDDGVDEADTEDDTAAESEAEPGATPAAEPPTGESTGPAEEPAEGSTARPQTEDSNARAEESNPRGDSAMGETTLASVEQGSEVEAYEPDEAHEPEFPGLHKMEFFMLGFGVGMMLPALVGVALNSLALGIAIGIILGPVLGVLVAYNV